MESYAVTFTVVVEAYGEKDAAGEALEYLRNVKDVEPVKVEPV